MRWMWKVVALAMLEACVSADEEVGAQSFNERYETAYCDRLSACEGEIVAWYIEEYGLSDPAAQDRYFAKYDAECNTANEIPPDSCTIDEYRADQCFDYLESFNCISLEEGDAPVECGMVCAARPR